nr:probable clathrin assembly protein At4g32285 [Tanacetum cinerariifolium]
MSSSTIRKAIGVVKDQTSISIAKVAGNVAPDLEVLIVKATGHDKEPAEENRVKVNIPICLIIWLQSPGVITSGGSSPKGMN